MADSKPSPTLEGGKVKNVKDAKEESQKEKANESFSALINQIKTGAAQAGVVAFLRKGLGRAPSAKELEKAKDAKEAYIASSKTVKKKKPSLTKTVPNPQQDTAKKVLNQDVAKGLLSEIREAARNPLPTPKPETFMKRGGMVKSSKKSLAGRLAKRGYGAARK